MSYRGAALFFVGALALGGCATTQPNCEAYVDIVIFEGEDEGGANPYNPAPSHYLRICGEIIPLGEEI
jgi:hypothetical protein